MTLIMWKHMKIYNALINISIQLKNTLNNEIWCHINHFKPEKKVKWQDIKNNTCYYNLQMNTLHKKANCDNENIKEGVELDVTGILSVSNRLLHL